MASRPKLRVHFCWSCGNKLRGNHFIAMEIEGYLHIMHKSCAEKAKEPELTCNVKNRLNNLREVIPNKDAETEALG